MGVDGTCTVRVFGRFSLEVEGRRVDAALTQRARALLVNLALRPQGVSRDKLVDDLWPEALADRGRDSLKSALSSIRRALRDAGADPDAYISTNSGIVRLAQTIRTGCELLEGIERFGEADLIRAMTECAGEFLEGDYCNWTVVQRERVNERYERVLARLIREYHNPEAARAMLARNPYDEFSYTLLIEDAESRGAHASAKRTALRALEAMRELGASVPSTLLEGYERLRRMDDAGAARFRLSFAGRANECSRAERALEECSTGTITFVSGVAGVGKSALLNAVLSARAQDDVVVLRCVEGDPRPYQLFARLYEERVGEPIERALTTSENPAAYIARAISNALPSGAPLVIDDAQWLTGSGRDVFERLVRHATASHPIVIAVRQEALEDTRARFADYPCVEIELEPLSFESLYDALDSVAPSARPSFARKLYDRTGGHPLFVAGFVSALVDERLLQFDGATWNPVGDFSGDLPKTIRRTIERRIRSIGPHAELLACAIALEPDALPSELAAVTGLNHIDFGEALDGLLSSGMLVERGLQFAFSHDVVREVARTLYNAARRARLHEGFVNVLAARDVANASLRTARHLEALSRPLDSSNAFAAAAEFALEAQAYDDAREHVRKALRNAERIADRRQQSETLARTYLLLECIETQASSGDAAIAAATSALQYARLVADPDLIAECLVHRAAVYANLHEGERYLADATEALAYAARTDNDQRHLDTAFLYADALRMCGNIDEPIDRFSELLERAKTRSNWQMAGSCAQRLAGLYGIRLDLIHARALIDVASDMYERWGGLLSQANAQKDRAFLLYLCDRNEDALEELSRAELLITQFKNQQLQGFSGFGSNTLLHVVRLVRALIFRVTGRFDEAIRDLDDMSAFGEFSGIRSYRFARDLLRIDTLLERNTGDDVACARDLCDELATFSTLRLPLWGRGVITLEGCRSRAAARMHDAAAPALLRSAIEIVADQADKSPCDADREFARLARGAAEIGNESLYGRASTLQSHYAERRRRAAELD